jgi:hypothetical protein
MTVTFKNIIAGSRRATNTKGVRNYSQSYLLTTDTLADTAYIVGSHASLPKIGDVFASDSYAYCTTLEVTNHAPFQGWTVTATWSTERTVDATDPTADEVMVSWSSEIYQEPVFTDVNGGSVTNSAGDYYIDPVPTRDNTHLIAKIRSNVTSVPTWVLSKQNNVNSGVIVIGGLSIPAKMARLCRLEIGERQLRGTTSFYQLSFEIHIHEVGWHLIPLDVGFRRLEYGEPVQIRTDDTGAIVLFPNGEEPTQPVLLDGTGEVLDVALLPAGAVYRDHQIYVESDLTTMPGIS